MTDRTAQASRKRALSSDKNPDPPEKRRLNPNIKSPHLFPPLPSPAMTPSAPPPNPHNEPPLTLSQTIDEDTHMAPATPPSELSASNEATDAQEVERALHQQADTPIMDDPFATPPIANTSDKKPQQGRNKSKQGKGKDTINQARQPASLPDPAMIHQLANRQLLAGTSANARNQAPTGPIPHTPKPIMLSMHTFMPILPRHPLPTAVNGVITRGDFKYTEYPRNMTHLYPQLGVNILMNHHPEQILNWESKTCNKVLVREFRAKFETDVEARRTTRTNIEETISSFLGEKTSFILSDPKVNTLSNRARIDPPWHTLVYDLTNEQTEKLLAHPIIATPSCVIIIAPLQQIIPTYLASITGITCKGNSEEGRRTVTDAVRKGLLSSSSLASDVDQIAGANTYQKIINGLNIYFVNTSEARPNEGWWNVESSGMPRHITIDQYRAITDRIKTLTFPTDDNGDGVALKKTRECMNCKSITHTVQTCPLYRMPGWLGPPKEEIEKENVGSKSTRGGGFRGRGGRRNGNFASRGQRGYSRRG